MIAVILIVAVVVVLCIAVGVVNDYFFRDGFFRERTSYTNMPRGTQIVTSTVATSGSELERAVMHELEQQLNIPLSQRVDVEPLVTSRPAQLSDATWVDFEDQDELNCFNYLATRYGYVPSRDSTPERAD